MKKKLPTLRVQRKKDLVLLSMVVAVFLGADQNNNKSLGKHQQDFT
jgi:hypothetical protein